MNPEERPSMVPEGGEEDFRERTQAFDTSVVDALLEKRQEEAVQRERDSLLMDLQIILMNTIDAAPKATAAGFLNAALQAIEKGDLIAAEGHAVPFLPAESKGRFLGILTQLQRGNERSEFVM